MPVGSLFSWLQEQQRHRTSVVQRNFPGRVRSVEILGKLIVAPGAAEMLKLSNLDLRHAALCNRRGRRNPGRTTHPTGQPCGHPSQMRIDHLATQDKVGAECYQ